MSLDKLAKFIESYSDFDQHSRENCVVGIGNRLDETFTKLNPHAEYEKDFFGTVAFSQRFGISTSHADAFYTGDYGYLGLKDETKEANSIEDAERDENNQSTSTKKEIIKILRLFAKQRAKIAKLTLDNSGSK